MLREGPIPIAAHGLIEYAFGALLIVAPFLFGFDSDTATTVAIVAGVLLLVVAASSDNPTSLVDQLPRNIHIVLDYVLAVGLIAAPFIFDFSDDGAATAFFIALGVAHLLVTIGTRFKPARPARGASPAARDR